MANGVTRQVSSKQAPKRRSRLRRSRTNNDGTSRAALERECQTLRDQCTSLRERAEAAEQLYRELLSVLSHDIRNPLSVVLVSTRLLDRICGREENVRRQIEATSRAADEINQMVEDLLDAASIGAGSFRLVASKPNEVAPIIERAYESALPLATHKPLELKREIKSGIPLALCDRDRIVQVLG